MWCGRCQAIVAGQAGADGSQAFCATCGSDLIPPPVRIPAKARDPRELLAKWAKEDALDVLGPWISGVESTTRSASTSDGEREPVSSTLPGFSSSPATDPRTEAAAVVSPDVGPVSQNDISERVVRIRHSAHRPADSGSPPLSDAARLTERLVRAIRSRRAVAVAGQLAAYGGVLALTSGALLLFAGHFSRLDNYIPMGWLAMICGQMLLFLGVVTLISSGMEQTTATVAQRIETLGQRLLRIEAAAELAGPHWPADRQGRGEEFPPDTAEQDLEAEIARLTQALAERRRAKT